MKNKCYLLANFALNIQQSIACWEYEQCCSRTRLKKIHEIALQMVINDTLEHQRQVNHVQQSQWICDKDKNRSENWEENSKNIHPTLKMKRVQVWGNERDFHVRHLMNGTSQEKNLMTRMPLRTSCKISERLSVHTMIPFEGRKDALRHGSRWTTEGAKPASGLGPIMIYGSSPCSSLMRAQLQNSNKKTLSNGAMMNQCKQITHYLAYD